MKNRKENLKKVFTQVLEPFALGLLALLFIIPTITVMNLSPVTKYLKELNVLGVTSQDDISLTLVEGKHEVFLSESLNKLEGQSFQYSVTLKKRAADVYSKPILEIENKSGVDKTIYFSGQTLTNTRSSISLLVDEKVYKLQDTNGQTYPQQINISPNEKILVFLSLENFLGVQFSEVFDMDINVVDNLKNL